MSIPTHNCEACLGHGAFICFNHDRDKHELIKCGTCDEYESNKEAWESLEPKED